MAKITQFKFPFSGIIGPFRRRDASRGRDGGFSATITKPHSPPVLRKTTALTPSKSTESCIRIGRYGSCDEYWKYLDTCRRERLPGWWTWARGRQKELLPAYQLWMKICMLDLVERWAYWDWCWVGRYAYFNHSLETLPEHDITLTGIPFSVSDGTDNVVYRIDVRGAILDDEAGISRYVLEPGSIRIPVLAMKPYEERRWDIYAYGDARPGQEERVTDGDFSEGLTHWGITVYAGGNITIEGDPPYAHLQTSATDGSFADLAQQINVAGLKWLSFGLRCNLDPGSYGAWFKVMMGIITIGAGYPGDVDIYYTRTASADGWINVYVDITAGVGVEHVHFGLKSYAGVSWIDIRNISTATPPPDASGIVLHPASSYLICTDTTPPLVPPVADFTAEPNPAVRRAPVQFTDLSTNSPTAWLWDFGDANTSEEQHPVHKYKFADTYTVSLTVSNADGEDTEIKVDYMVITPK